jgi:hypothetical protein
MMAASVAMLGGCDENESAKDEKLVESYLKEKYPDEEFVTQKVQGYSVPGTGNAMTIYFSPKDHEDLVFKTTIQKEDKSIYDWYPETLINYGINKVVEAAFEEESVAVNSFMTILGDLDDDSDQNARKIEDFGEYKEEFPLELIGGFIYIAKEDMPDSNFGDVLQKAFARIYEYAEMEVGSLITVYDSEEFRNDVIGFKEYLPGEVNNFNLDRENCAALFYCRYDAGEMTITGETFDQRLPVSPQDIDRLIRERYVDEKFFG